MFRGRGAPAAPTSSKREAVSGARQRKAIRILEREVPPSDVRDVFVGLERAPAGHRSCPTPPPTQWREARSPAIGTRCEPAPVSRARSAAGDSGRKARSRGLRCCGAERDRTVGLLNAILIGSTYFQLLYGTEALPDAGKRRKSRGLVAGMVHR